MLKRSEASAGIRDGSFAARRLRTCKHGERGFTLAGVIVIMTIMMIFVAYTVPRQWSAIRQRDREQQTIFIMRQYAIAIDAFEKRNRALPVNISQLKDARQPRFVRGPKAEWIDPLTGEVDWLIIPQAAAPAPPPPPQPGTPPAPAPPSGIPMKDYAGGPFIGVRPNKTGDSLIELNGMSKYEQWTYTVVDYRNERNARLMAAQKVWQ
jgi:type II secretory pathway pseudopilin PulG